LKNLNDIKEATCSNLRAVKEIRGAVNGQYGQPDAEDAKASRGRERNIH